VQEALTNIGKHAAATRVTVKVVEGGDRITIEITDDGTGFDASHGTKGFGLVGMRERVALLDGGISIVSAPGRGTTVTADLPSGRPLATAHTG
jgi:signal transduction histidine kinase